MSMSNASSNTPPKKSGVAHIRKYILAGGSRKNDSQQAPWGPFRALLGVVASFIGVQIIISIIVALFLDVKGWDDVIADRWLSETGVQFLLLMLSEVFTLLIIWLFVQQYPWQKVKAAIGFRRIRWHDAGYALLGVALYFAAYVAFLTFIRLFVNIDLDQEQDIGFQSAQGFMPLALTFIGLVILAPITEEIVFRGYLFAGMRKWLGIIGAAIITSVIFSLPHLIQSTDDRLLWVAAIDTFVLSLVLCFLRVKTGSIYAGIGVHAVKNCIAFLALFIFTS